jgi:hypothetical protein
MREINKPQRRSKTVSTKVTAEEYQRLVSVARPERLGEWLRRVVLSTGAPRPVDQLLLSETLALRTIVLNLLFAVAAGEPVTVESMQRLIDRTDRDKAQQAFQRLVAVATRTS